MIKLTKKLRRKFLDIGFRNMIDQDLYLYLLDRTTKSSNIVEFSYEQFFKDLEKTCSIYTVSERNIYRILERVVAIGVVRIQVSGYGEALPLVKPLHELFCHRSEEMTDPSNAVVDKNKSPKSDTKDLNPKNGIDQQQLIYADQKTRSVGMVFNKKDLWKIAKFPRELIDKATDYYRFARERTHIPSPTGWLICCLRDKWYVNFKPEKYVSSAQQKLFELQDWFIENFGSVPKRVESDFFGRIPIPSQ